MSVSIIDHLGHEPDMVHLMVKQYGCEDLNGGDFPKFWQDPFSKKDFRRKELRKFLPRLLVALAWFYFCVFVNNLSQAWLQENMAGFYESEWGYSQASFQAAQKWLKEHEPEVYKTKWGNTPPNATKSHDPSTLKEFYANQTVTLYDLVFLYLPTIHGSGPADAWAGLPSLIGLIRFVILPGPMSLRWTWLIRVFFVWGTLWLCRSFTIIVTPLPNPYHQCIPVTRFPGNIWAEAFANLPGVFWWNVLTCQDVMFSGHTAMGTTWTLFAWSYSRRAPWFRATLTWDWMAMIVDFFAWGFLLLGWYLICGSHFHYTVDVMVGAMLSFFMFNSYHNFIETIWLKETHPLKRTLAPFFMWLEEHSVDLAFWRAKAQKLMDERVREHRWVKWRGDSRNPSLDIPSDHLIQIGGNAA